MVRLRNEERRIYETVKLQQYNKNHKEKYLEADQKKYELM